MKDIENFLNNKKYVNILKELVRINSSNPPGNELDMALKILSILPENKIQFKVVESGNNRGSLIVNLEGKNHNNITAFAGHIDTVPAGDEKSWTYPPFDGYTDGKYMYGRGTSDMKGGVTSMILTLLYFTENDIVPPCDIHFYFTADEEANGTGILDIMKSGYTDNINEIFICEPSNEKIGICEKGALWVKINTSGKQSHGSMPHLGVNAIEKTYEFIEKIKNECIDLNKDNPLLGKNTVSVTGFNGGIKTNIIPPSADASLDIRTIPGSSHDKIIKDINKTADDIVSCNKNLKFEIEITNNRPPLEIDENSSFINKIKDVYRKLNYSPAYKGIYFYTDASQLIPKINVPFVILGPGDTGMAHQKDEKIEIESIGRTANIYINYILQQ